MRTGQKIKNLPFHVDILDSILMAEAAPGSGEPRQTRASAAANEKREEMWGHLSVTHT